MIFSLRFNIILSLLSGSDTTSVFKTMSTPTPTQTLQQFSYLRFTVSRYHHHIILQYTLIYLLSTDKQYAYICRLYLGRLYDFIPICVRSAYCFGSTERDYAMRILVRQTKIMIYIIYSAVTPSVY